MRIAIDWRRIARDGLILAVIALFLTLTGVYNATTHLSLPLAWGYWMLTLIVGTLAGWSAAHLLEREKPSRTYVVIAALIIAIAASAAVTAVIVLLTLLQGFVPPLTIVLELFPAVMLITFGMMTIGYLIERAFGDSPIASGAVGAAGPAGDPTAAFMDRLPVKYRGAELYAVSSEDHYLRVHTDRGEEMILMRLADAIRELSGADGLQTHRSWWVARDGVADVRRDGGKLSLMLKSGGEAPVSRTYQKKVRETGLI